MIIQSLLQRKNGVFSWKIHPKIERKIASQKQAEHICVGILAHVDAGKTTLAEGILYQTGQIRKLGRVDHKDAFLDTYAMEKERGITSFPSRQNLPLERKK